MALSKMLFAVVRILGIHVALLLAGVLFDIFLSVFVPRPVFLLCTIVCFGVAGVFCGLFCYGSVSEKASKEHKEKVALYTALAIATICLLLFFAVAPLSGREYNWAIKTFAITQALTTFFLWKGKFHNETGKTW